MPLYKLTSPSGKSYIGITSQKLTGRFAAHKWCSRNGKLAINEAIRKYGFDNMRIEVLDETCDMVLLHALEVAAIAQFNTRAPNGYNLTAGGDGVRGRVEPEDAKKVRIAKVMTARASKSPAEKAESSLRYAAAARKRCAAYSPEKKKSISAKRAATIGFDRFSEMQRSRCAQKTPEQRRASALKREASKTPEQRAASTVKAMAARTPEQRSTSARKAWETRRANQNAA